MTSKMQIVNDKGQRLYLTEDERQALLVVAGKADRDIRAFCRVLVFSGCRISEALELKASRIDMNAKVITFRSLKKRKDKNGNPVIHNRQVPVPSELLDCLDNIYNLRQRKGKQRNEQLWTWERMTAWRKMKDLMAAAGIVGPQASPKGLRHGFGVNAVSKGIALNMVQKWLGHAAMTTTAIYANAVGEEEQSIAARMWS
jgi:site-specific recombinase XerD